MVREIQPSDSIQAPAQSKITTNCAGALIRRYKSEDRKVEPSHKMDRGKDESSSTKIGILDLRQAQQWKLVKIQQQIQRLSSCWRDWLIARKFELTTSCSCLCCLIWYDQVNRQSCFSRTMWFSILQSQRAQYSHVVGICTLLSRSGLVDITTSPGHGNTSDYCSPQTMGAYLESCMAFVPRNIDSLVQAWAEFKTESLDLDCSLVSNITAKTRRRFEVNAG